MCSRPTTVLLDRTVAIKLLLPANRQDQEA
jgi:hypothetical protein